MLHDLIHYDHKVLYYGPKTASQIASTLGKYHKTNRTALSIPAKHEFTYQQQTENQVLMADYDMVQSEITWLRINEKFSPEELPKVRMFNEYFGGNMSGIVFQDIRESKALAYSAYASYGTPSKKEDPFYMMGYVGCQADKMKESINAMQALLD